jgi:hypothetical protein
VARRRAAGGGLTARAGQLLVEAGADIRARDLAGRTPWELAGKRGGAMRRLEWDAEAPDAPEAEL